jgi:molecular chaperone IbpA
LIGFFYIASAGGYIMSAIDLGPFYRSSIGYDRVGRLIDNALDISVENGVLTISGGKGDETRERQYLHQGIANRAFERRFNLAEHVEVTEAALSDGMLTVNLRREVPEAMKPRSIPIEDSGGQVLEHEEENTSAQSGTVKAA